MFMEVLCCILMLASYVVVYIQIRLEDKWYYGAIYEAEKIRYERACKEEVMTRKEAIEILDEQHLAWTLKKAESYCVEVNEAIDMAIEALQTVEDHEETFEWCHDCKEYDQDNYCCHRWSKRIRETVHELEQYYEVGTEMSSPNWIPCSERLPRERGDYLIWYRFYDVIKDKTMSACKIAYYSTELEHWLGLRDIEYSRDEVLAWMPLPEPYSIESDGIKEEE